MDVDILLPQTSEQLPPGSTPKKKGSSTSNTSKVLRDRLQLLACYEASVLPRMAWFMVTSQKLLDRIKLVNWKRPARCRVCLANRATPRETNQNVSKKMTTKQNEPACCTTRLIYLYT